MNIKHVRRRVVAPRRRKKGACRLFATSAIVVSAAFAGRPAAAQPLDRPHSVADRQATRFDIAAGPVDAALRAFEAGTGLSLDVRLPADTASLIQSPGVAGMHSWRHALQALLADTGLVFRAAPNGAFIIEVARLAETLEVSAPPGVSSPTLTSPLVDIPQTITVISSQVIEEQGATTLRDALRNVAGITFQAGEGGVPAGDTLTMRGFSARTDMFVDGVRDVGGYSRDAFNLERVEVAKGPASSTAGRGSTGGAINQVTKAPSLTPSMAGSVGAGNAGYVRSTVDANLPLDAVAIPGTAVRLNAMWTDTDTPNRDEVHASRWGVAPSIGLGMGTHTRATLSTVTLRQDNLPEYGLPWVPANTNPDLQAFANGAPPVDQSNYYGLVTRDYERTDTDLVTVDLAQDVNSATTLRNLTRWGRNVRDSVITAPRFAAVNTSTAITRQLQSRDMTDTILAHQTNLTSRFATGAIGHAVSAGIELASESSDNKARIGPAAPSADLFHPNPRDPYPGPIVPSGASTHGAADSLAAYAFDTVTLGGRVVLSGGLRWDRFAVDYTSVAASGDVATFARTDAVVSGRGGIVFKPRPQGSVYLGYGTAFNPSAEGLSLTAANASLAPERTRSLEAGTKWDLVRRRLSATAAVFSTAKTNARTPGVNPGDPPTVLVGEQRVSGVEVGVSGRLKRWWTALANYAFMTSRVAASNTAGEVDQNLALTPAHTLALWTTVALPKRVGVGAGVQYMDSVFRNATNTAQVPGYWLVSGTASYEVGGHLTLRLNGTNLSDRRYVDRIGGGHYIPGPGRQVMLTATVAR